MNGSTGIDNLPFEGYEVLRKIGTGAASTIYEVRHIDTEELRAVKHVIRGEGEDKRMIEQVENEFKVAQRIDHPYIRKVYDIRRRRRRMQTREVFMLMELCPGVSLEQGSSHSLLDLLLIFRMVAEGLQGMHAARFLHCDMKPNNIIIADNGAIRLIDLGQSCSAGTVKPRIQGTPDYIAPEQVKRKPLSEATDVFNLGATMYWAFSGKHIPTLIPKNRDRIELMTENRPGRPATPSELRPQIPQGVSNLIMDCVKESPADRPSNMMAIISRLDILIRMIAGKRLATNSVK